MTGRPLNLAVGRSTSKLVTSAKSKTAAATQSELVFGHNSQVTRHHDNSVTLDRPFQEFVSKAVSTLHELKTASKSIPILDEDLPRILAKTVEGSMEFLSVVANVVDSVPRYSFAHRGKGSPKEKEKWREQYCGLEVEAFCRRSGFYQQVVSGDVPSPHSLINRFLEEAMKTKCTETRLVVFDGLSTGSIEINGTTRIRRLSSEELDEFFETGLVPSFTTKRDIRRLSKLVFLEITREIDVPSLGHIEIDWDSAEHAIKQVAQPWLNYVNLWSLGSVRTTALYKKLDFLLTWPAVREQSTSQPSFYPEFITIYDEEEPVEIEQLHITVDVHDHQAFGEFLHQCEHGRSVSISHSQRVETALRFFSRCCSALWEWGELLNREDLDLSEDHYCRCGHGDGGCVHWPNRTTQNWGETSGTSCGFAEPRRLTSRRFEIGN